MVAVMFGLLLFCGGYNAAQVTFHVNNCLQDMTFWTCFDVIGSFIEKPTTYIPQYSRGEWIINLPENAQIQQGNCTYNYTNSNGNWTAFFSWDWSWLGGESAGGGTQDELDNEITVMGMKHDLACFWLYYESEGQMDCTYRTNDTHCHPDDSKKLSISHKKQNN
mmetsp:Transcript_43224/g.53094  ORF Transcript_43224/g.53094 Transcript_43224/m.53094 type:complete len:164 (+) Transcript_43224:102-593(+)